MPWSHGKFYWNELMTRDVERTKKFYADTMGWSFDAMPMGGGTTYWIAKMGGESVGGMFDISGPDYKGVPEGWMPYIAVDDVDAFDVPGVGRIAILTQPGGAGIGWMTPVN
jgi:uncharacterized protein